MIEGNVAAVKAWLDAGLSPVEPATATTCFTPVGIASNLSNPEVLTLLLAHGGDPNADTGAGQTPLDCAKGTRKEEVIAILNRAGAKPSSPREPEPQPSPREPSSIQRVKTAKGIVLVGESWDSALTKLESLGTRTELIRLNPDAFVDVRAGYRFTFTRPTPPEVGAYRIAEIARTD